MKLTSRALVKVLSGILVAFAPKRPKMTGCKAESSVPFLNLKVRKGSEKVEPSAGLTSKTSAEA